MDSSKKKAYKKMLAAVASKMLLSYAFFKLVVPRQVETAYLESQERVCTPATIHQTLLQNGGNPNSMAEGVLFARCLTEFLNENRPSPIVKEVVDEWIGIDLSKASLEELFSAYQITLVNSSPRNVTQEFVYECKLMLERYEEFREITAGLAQHIDIDELLPGDRQLDDLERSLLDYAQYSLLCDSIIPQ